MSLLSRWSIFHIFTAYVYFFILCIAYSYPLYIFVFFFSLIYPEILLGATCNSVYMVLYNLQSTFHMYDIL